MTNLVLILFNLLIAIFILDWRYQSVIKKIVLL